MLDPNLRSALPVPALAPLLPRVGLLVLGQDESRVLFGESDPERVFAAAAAAGVGEVVLKGGPEGAWYAGTSGPVHVPSTAREVRDPVGAGDAFLGGYLAARLSGAGPGAATRLGAELAGRVVATPGDTPGLPGPDTARALLRRALGKEAAARTRRSAARTRPSYDRRPSPIGRQKRGCHLTAGRRRSGGRAEVVT
ncbi:carbohydrate kinase family protein [Nonomuraea fuscirosea]|uniref:carbohydrate kinase family protein n=1 Tax=Nonomuraea fuscirosea TaxID=1291556 RepID=UPI0033C44A37